MSHIQFFVAGIPGTAGSKKFIGHANPTKPGQKFGRALLIDASGKKGKDWRNIVASTGQDAFYEREPITGPVFLAVHFVLPYRKADLRKDGTPKPKAPHHHTTKPDATKMLRAVEDALTGIAWKDDAQIARQLVTKTYGAKPGATITISLI